MSKLLEGMGTQDSLFGESRPFLYLGRGNWNLHTDLLYLNGILLLLRLIFQSCPCLMEIHFLSQWSKHFVYSQEVEVTGVVPAIILGIYQTEAPYHPLRHYDFTLTSLASIGDKRKYFSTHTY